MTRREPELNCLQGRGFDPRTGGFLKIVINGVEHDAQWVASLIRLASCKDIPDRRKP